MNIFDYIEHIESAFSEAAERMYGAKDVSPLIARPPENIDAEIAVGCFPLARIARKSPAKIAAEMREAFPARDWLAGITVSGPYLNFQIDPASLFRSVIHAAMTEPEAPGFSRVSHPQSILVEYSSPNTNKPLHLGHIRNNVLGMAVINLLRARGHRVYPATILNDRGIHICKAMVAYRRFAMGKTPESEGVKGDHFVGDLYVTFSQAADSDPSLMEEARETLVKWEQGDPETLELWKKLNDWVYQGFDETYRRLGSVFEVVQHESDTYHLGRKIAMTGLEKGVFYRKSDGSVWCDLRDIGLDEKAILRADGTSLYLTQDLGVAVERFEKYNLDQVVYVVGSEQIYHFKVLFEILRRLGYSWADRCHHLSYGMVYLPEGKMKSREGKVVDADDLMDSMKTLAETVMARSGVSLEPDRKDETAEAVALGAIKYYLLKVNASRDIHFNPEESLSFEGATGAYLQYTCARIHSIERKAGGAIPADIDFSVLQHPEEIQLARQALYFPLAVKQSADEMSPSRLAGALFDLAKQFNGFYHKLRVIDAGSESLKTARLALSHSVRIFLESGMNILGIHPLEKM